MTSIHRHFSSLLLSLPAETQEGRINLSSLAQILGNRSAAALLLFLALPMVLPIPAPGISVVFGVPLIVISIQLILGSQTLWLPRQIASRSISEDQLNVYIEHALPAVLKLEYLVRPRLPKLSHGLALQGIGGMCLVLALIIALPVPLGHLVPAFAISVMAVGLIEHDGLMIITGFLIGVLAIIVVTLAMIGLTVVGRSLLAS